MTAVFLLRHPETTWNLQERYQGRLESPVSVRGAMQAALVTRVFVGQKLDAVYSSPLRRARALADLLVEGTGAPLTVDQRLTEIGQIPWEGLHLHEIKHRYPEMFEEWYSHPEGVTFSPGECLIETQNRALSAMNDIMTQYPSGQVAVVTHSVVIQTAVCAALCLDLRNIHRLRISNAGITTFCGVEAPGSLLSFNSTDALFPSPVVGAAMQDCVSWKARRITA